MKKVLIITYYWPPAGGPGVQRWLKFVKYLPEFDIEPIVYCPENPCYPTLDSTLSDDLSDNITILKHPIRDPLRFLKFFFKTKTKAYANGLIPTASKQSILDRFLIFIRGNFFIPDARIFWVKPSYNFLSDYISNNKVDTIITTGPPHSLHLIGMRLKAKHLIKWFCDFRDPWVDINYHQQLRLTKYAKKQHLMLEKKVLYKADHIIVTSAQTKLLFSNKTNQPITVVTNGFDDASNSNVKMDLNFTLTHIGFLSSQRNPSILWDVLSELIHELTDFKEKFKLVLVGIVSVDAINAINAFGLEPYLDIIETVSHFDAAKYQRKSQVLLLLEGNTKAATYIIPGKLFEYVNAQRPIIAIGPQPSDIKSILEETNTGNYFKYDEKEALKHQIIELFTAYKNNNLCVNPREIGRYSRRNCTKQLSQILKF
ncbi:MAG: glycosyl transferase family 1 [Flavobacteriaceae bacterium]|nr:glycosyl transferase family 1 [Flavobacteriaceae bacterium]|tara:strand:- start:24271 stop:25551 length:1281 start_codon:yes stop_codon:yes gene_type:complete